MEIPTGRKNQSGAMTDFQLLLNIVKEFGGFVKLEQCSFEHLLGISHATRTTFR